MTAAGFKVGYDGAVGNISVRASALENMNRQICQSPCSGVVRIWSNENEEWNEFLQLTRQHDVIFHARKRHILCYSKIGTNNV